MNNHRYCQRAFIETNFNKVKLTGKFERDRRGRSEVFVYNKDRVQVYHTMDACCVHSAKMQYLESLPSKKKGK